MKGIKLQQYGALDFGDDLVEDGVQVSQKPKKSITGTILVSIGIISIGLIAIIGVFVSNKSSNDTASSSVVGYGGIQLYGANDNDFEAMFAGFMTDYDKSYSTTAEYNTRLQIFKNNMQIVDNLNVADHALGGTAEYGITQFSDLSADEFQRTYLADMTPPSQNSDGRIRSNWKSGLATTSYGIINWSGTYTTRVRNQGKCSCCYAFSASEQVESDSIRLGISYNSSAWLSPQQILSCSSAFGNSGCSGGHPAYSYDYMNSYAIVSDSSYPYTQLVSTTAASCISSKVSAGKGLYKVYFSYDDEAYFTFLNWGTFDSYTSLEIEQTMSNYLLTTGPLSVLLDASNWASYKSGTIASCLKNNNHNVQIVGVTYYNTPSDYWLVRNSWGTSWGLSGYARLKYGNNTCNIASYPSYTIPYRATN